MLIGASAGLWAQTTFVGFGPTYSLPQASFDSTNKGSFGGSVVYASRKYCQLWTGLRLSYTSFQRKTDTTRSYYTTSVMLSPEARYFFAQPLDFPFYVHAMLNLSGIGGTDSATRAGLGLGLGVGYLLFYNSNCCGWFLDLHAQYQLPNLILRDSSRPSLPSILIGLSFNLGL
ncbi:MAG: hypothetical protein ABI876_07570 [Bacteroidota bacterium]